MRRTGGPTVAYSQNVWTETGKMNVGRHELRHFSTINLTFSTDFTSLMCSGVQTIWGEKKSLISQDASRGRGAQLRDEFKFYAEKLSEDASRTNHLRNVYMYSYITVLMPLQIRTLSPPSTPFSNTNFRSRPTRTHLILRIPNARFTANFSTHSWMHLVRSDPT